MSLKLFMNGLLLEPLSRFNGKRLRGALLPILLIGSGFASILPTYAATSTVEQSITTTTTTTVTTQTVTSTAEVMVKTYGNFNPKDYGLAAAYAMTPKTRREIYAWNEDLSWPAASLTKLVSALAWKDRVLPMNKIVPLLKQDEVGGGRLRVAVGTKVYFEDLWYSSITASANNAAMALARLSGLTTKELLAKMNAEAKLAGAKNAHFVDPSGMEVENVASAKEMALIADRAFSVRAIQKAASMTRYVVSVIGKKTTAHPIWTTNTLLRYDPDVWVIAGKTGYLDESRHNLVVWMRPVGVDGKPVLGKDVLIVVYGAPDTKKLFASAKALAQSIWKSDAFTPSQTTPARTK